LPVRRIAASKAAAAQAGQQHEREVALSLTRGLISTAVVVAPSSESHTKMAGPFDDMENGLL
jgi:hypothetical protein